MASVPTPRSRRSADGPATQGPELRRVPLFDLDLVDAPGIDHVAEALLAELAQGPPDDGRLPVVVTPNVDILVDLEQKPDSLERRVFDQARYVLPDGMPLVAVSGLLGHRLSSRLTGSDLFALLWPRLAAAGLPVVAVCANDEIAERLGAEHGAARFVVPPMIDADDPAARSTVVDQVQAEVAEIDARCVVFGLGHPRDARLAHELCHRSEPASAPLCLGVGGALGMYVGQTRRAPVLLQRIGAEWLYRFCQEPRRLFHRYFVRDLAFIPLTLRHLRRRLPGGSRG